MTMSKTYRARPSQALIIMTMVMAVSLVVGVAISSRVVTTLRQISYTEQSALALSFAESGVEDALKRLKDNPSLSLPYSSDDVAIGGGHFNYTISQAGGNTVFDDLSPIEKDKAVQVNLEGYQAAGGLSINVYWVDSGNPAETGDNRAAIEISVVYFDGTEYKLKRDAYDPIQTLDRGLGNKFYDPTDPAYGGRPGGDPGNGVTYQHRVEVSLPGGSKLLRLRAIYNNVPNSFAVVGTVNLPLQGQLIESTGYDADIQRKVQVTRTLPALSELFDFVIFSGAGL